MVTPTSIWPRSSVAQKVPLASEVGIGGLAINLKDRSLYSKGYDGIVFRLEGDGGNGTVASASTIDLDSLVVGFVDVTGTSSISAITLAAGRSRSVRFTGVLSLVNSANLVLPGGANITTAAGDFATFRGYAGGVVRCVYYGAASGSSLLQQITDDTTTNATMYPTWVNTSSGPAAAKVSSTKLTFNPLTGLFSAPSFAGALNGTVGITTPAAAAFTSVSASLQITSTLASGTAPLVVASNTQVANLNSSLLIGKTWAVPGDIGTTTPGIVAMTSGSTTSNFGIRTSSPSFALDVNSNVIGLGTKTAASGQGGNIRFRDDTGSARWLLGMLGTAGATVFNIYDIVASAVRIGVNSTGEVCIGAAPSSGHKLEVIGTGKISSSLLVGTGFGCNGASPQTAYSVGAAATDAATTQSLVNNIRAALIANGIAA